MKKSIFLFFAAILCAVNASAWSYKTAANNWTASTSGFTNVTMNSGNTMDVVMLKDVGDGVNICQNDNGSGHTLYCKWTKTSGDIFRGTARWNNGLYSDETVVIPEGKVYIKVGSGTQVQMTAGADYTYTADVTFSNTGESYTISGGTVNGATIEAQNSMPSGGKPASLTMSNSYTSEKSGNVHIVFDLKTNKVTETADSEPEPVANVTVHVINSAKWAAVACYHWGEGGAGTEWPGDVLSKTNEFAGYDVYTATFTGEHTSCIFNNNNNGKQTGDLIVQNGQYYDLKSKTWYASLADVPAPDPLATDVFLVGSMNAWSTTANEFKKVEEGSATATLTMNLEAETEYEFKVVREGAWTSRKDQDDNKIITETIEGLQFSSSNSMNCKMKTNLAGPYIFTWEISTSKLSITYPIEEVIITYTYTIAGAEALVGSYWSTTDTNNDMADADNDGVYTLTKTDRTLAKGTYEYKVVYDHDWDVGQYPASGQGNKSVSIEEDGIYTIEFTFNPGTKELNAAPTKTGEAAITHTVQLAGSMTEWATSPIDFTVDGTTATLETTLQAGLHEFKIIADGNWLTNSGTMTRLSSSEWTFGTGDNNAKLFAEIAGTYKFTWDIDNSKLTVVFPDFDGTYPTIGIAGDMNEWEGSTNQSSTVVDGKTTVAITLEEQKTYEFKVCVGDVMLGNPGTMQNSSSTGWEFHTYDGNAKIMTYAAGEYQFVWEHAKHQLSVIYPDGEITTLPEVYLAGSMLGNENWDAGKQAFVASADEKTASYTYNFTERDKTYEFKIIQNESWLGNSGNMKRSSCEGWTFDVHNSSNASIYMDIPGDYVFTWEYATNKLTVTYPELPKVALRGTMCGWNEATEIELQTMDDQAHAYVKVNLEANTYEFKIFEGDSWLSNNDAGTMNKSNNANWPFTTTQNNNTKVKIETAGNYYFIWNYAAQKLTVTYPVTIDEDAADNSKYSGYNSKIADVIVNRAFVNTYWQTITLPFSMNAAQINAMFGANTQVAKLASSEVQSKNNDDFVLNFDFVNTIDAGTPYLIKPANNVAEGAKVEGVVINTNTTNITTDGAWMIAVLDKKTNSNAKDYWLAENGYLYPFNNTEIKALRAYFYFPNISTASPVRARVAFNENVETEVENITAPEIKAIKVIQNGQLIIIRDGVKYNVQGQVIR